MIFNIFGIFRKMNINVGMKKLWIYRVGHNRTGTIFEVISLHFRGGGQNQGTECNVFAGSLEMPRF